MLRLPSYVRRFMLPMSFSFCPDDGLGGGGTNPPPVVPPVVPPVTQPPGSINPADHQRAIDDMLKYKNAEATARAELEAIKTAKLKEANDYKTLAEKYEGELAQTKAENKRIQDAIVERERTSALKAKVAALGLRPEAESDLESLDLSALRIETTSTGKINVLGVGEYAERLKASKPHWFADKAAPNVNTGSPRAVDSTAPITPQDLITAQREGQKSKNMSAYYELHKKYQQQRAAGRG